MGASRRVTFASGPLQLEGILHEGVEVPNAAATAGRRAALVCHPHPLYGGTMHNNVVSAVCHELEARGWTALRFNFRGVGRSQGRYGGNEAARDDAVAALDFLVQSLPEPPRALAVAGYSFGAWAGLAAGAAEPLVTAMAGISPGLSASDFGFLKECAKPKLLVYGTADEYVDRATASALLAALPEPKEERVFPGVDHFWALREPELAIAVADFFNRSA